jgi:GMP synthase-like glutamine amidotransferase
MIRIAILDLYEGQPNQGMRCLKEIIAHWSSSNQIEVECHEYDVRLQQYVPDHSFHIYISSGGPGSPLESKGLDWEKGYFRWLSLIENWNADPLHTQKKIVFFICHSFQLVCRHYALAEVNKRKSTSFGVFPVHLTPAGKNEVVFKKLGDPFYVVDSRDWQVVQPDHKKMQMMGAEILCLEKERPHVPYEQAVMGIRFNEYMIGTQFHPEADALGMSMHLQKEDKKAMVIKNFGEEKWCSMIKGLNDPDKIMFTYHHILPNFLNSAVAHWTMKMNA